SFSMVGPSIRHGVHQGAQKSTTTGTVESKTSDFQLLSVNSITLAMVGASPATKSIPHKTEVHRTKRSNHGAARNFESWGHYKVGIERVNNPIAPARLTPGREPGWFRGIGLSEIRWLHALVVFVPFAIILRWSHASPGWQFSAALLSLLPLAA